MTPIGPWAKSDFDAAYKIRLERYTGGRTKDSPPQIYGRYERRALFNPDISALDYITPEWERILAHFGWPTTTSIYVVGCGFGWSIEYLRSQGFTNTWGCDTSPYIQAAKLETDPADGVKRALWPSAVRDDDLADGEGRDALVAATLGRGKFDVAVTERVMSSLSDADALTLRANVALLANSQVHIETSGTSGQLDRMRFRTLAELKALFPDDTIVSSGGREIV